MSAKCWPNVGQMSAGQFCWRLQASLEESPTTLAQIGHSCLSSARFWLNATKFGQNWADFSQNSSPSGQLLDDIWTTFGPELAGIAGIAGGTLPFSHNRPLWGWEHVKPSFECWGKQRANAEEGSEFRRGKLMLLRQSWDLDGQHANLGLGKLATPRTALLREAVVAAVPTCARERVCARRLAYQVLAEKARLLDPSRLVSWASWIRQHSSPPMHVPGPPITNMRADSHVLGSVVVATRVVAGTLWWRTVQALAEEGTVQKS